MCSVPPTLSVFKGLVWDSKVAQLTGPLPQGECFKQIKTCNGIRRRANGNTNIGRSKVWRNSQHRESASREVWRLRSHSNHVILESCTVSKFEKWNYILFKRKAGFRHKAQESKSCISGSTSALESYVHSIHGLRFHHHF